MIGWSDFSEFLKNNNSEKQIKVQLIKTAPFSLVEDKAIYACDYYF